MKKISLKDLQNIDIKLFYYARHTLFKIRVRIYLVVLLLIIKEVFLKTPYVNILIAGNRDMLDAVTVPFLLTVILWFNARILILIALALFIPLAILSVLGHEAAAESLSNNIYMFLAIGVISMVIRFVRHENK